MDYNTYIDWSLMLDLDLDLEQSTIQYLNYDELRTWYSKSYQSKVNWFEWMTMGIKGEERRERRDGWVTCMIDWFDWMINRKSSNNKG